MGLIKGILIFIALAIPSMPILFWITHLLMTTSNTNRYGFANYKTFREEIEKRDGWHIFMDSIENKKSDSQIGNDIIKFNGVGMMLFPISYIRAKRYEKKFKQKLQEEGKDTFKIGYDKTLWE